MKDKDLKEEQVKGSCYVVIGCAVATDRSFMVYTKPIAIYRVENSARQAAAAERERQTVIIRGQECRMVTAVVEVKDLVPPPKAKEGYVVFSNAYLKDGSGGTMARVDGVYGKEDKAMEKLRSIPQGEQKLNHAQLMEVMSQVAKVPIV